ncbi:MAG: hypothetical protein AAGA47_06215 [Pseudomonadota bacterium]
MITAVPPIIYTVATAIAVLTAGYFWSRSRAISGFILIWFASALTLNSVGFFPGIGIWSDGDVARMMAYGVAMAAPVLIYLWARPRFAAMIDAVPTPLLAATQVYRLAGATFLIGYLHGSFPAEVALPAAALDTFIGLSALPVAYVLTHRPARGMATAWNLVGLFDFALAFTVISASLFGLWTLSPAPSAIGQSPSILISLFQVPLAIIIHIEMLRRLARRAESQETNPA